MDIACYGALCKITQPYLMRYPLTETDGNMGTQEGNGMEAASRYCVTGDTLIPTEKGLISIGEIAKKTLEHSEENINLKVYGARGQSTTAHKIVNSGKQNVKEITLRNSQKIKVTDNHPLLTLRKDLTTEWKTCKELKVGDKILYPLFNGLGFGEYNDLYEAAMLGCMISEGYATVQNRIGINNKDMDMIYPVMKWIALNWGENLGCLTENKERGYFEYSVASKQYYKSFVDVYEFTKSIDKHIPKMFFTASKEYQSTLLRYLFEGDGSVNQEYGVSYSSISETLIRQLQLILQMNFGIFSYIKYSNTRNEIKLYINKASLEKFKQEINFVSERKKNELTKCIKTFQEKRWANNNYYCISEINDYLRNKYPCRIIERYNFSNVKNYSKVKDLINSEDYEKIKFLVDNYATIEIIDKKDAGEECVYCFSIDDEEHAFIGNGFINHNTNCRPSKYGDLMMTDFKKNIVPLKETYNGEYYEPVVLPSLLPNAIINGRETVAIGLSHNSLPHNLTEVCNGIIAYIKNNNITIDELMEYIKGPDFPLGNVVINAKDIKTAFETGHSSVSLKVRGDYKVEKDEIIFTTLPYRTYRNKIKEQISNNIDAFEEVVEDFADLSNVGDNKLIFKIKPGATVEQALRVIFGKTDLQTTLSYNMNYIVNGTPKMCTMIDLISAYVNHQINIILKIAEYDMEKALARIHILEALIKAVDAIDEVIRLIKASDNKNEARKALMEFLEIDEIQANAILDMKLSRLTKIDKKELFDELKEKCKVVEECEKIINDKSYRDSKLIDKINEMKLRYGDARRTQLLNLEIPKESKEVIEVEPEKCVVIMTESGYIKRIPADSFKTQHRNTKGLKNQDSIINCVIRTNTVDNLLAFTNKGKLYRVLVENIPTGTNASKGSYINTLCNIPTDEKVNVIYSIYRDTDAKYLLFTTANGIVKKTSLDEYLKTRKRTGLEAIKLRENDRLVSINLIKEEDVVLITKLGMCIRFSSTEVGSTGRSTMGVKGITLKENDSVVSTLVVRNSNDYIGIFASNGCGKKIAQSEINTQRRSGLGIICSKNVVAAAAMINDKDNLLICGNNNSLCIEAKEIPEAGRAAQGNIIIKDNKIIQVSTIV